MPSNPAPGPHTTHTPIWPGLALLAAAALASVWFVGQMARLGESLEHHHALRLVETTAGLLDVQKLQALQGRPEDAGTPSHDEVLAQLRAIRLANPEFRFVYLMRPVQDDDLRFVFLADAEAAESKDYSAPGDVYEGPSVDLRMALATRQPTFSASMQDEWGAWVSAVAPVMEGDRVVALLGVDMPLATWNEAQDRYRDFGMVISGLVLALVALFLLSLHLQRRAGQRMAVLGRQLAARLGELEQAQEGLRMADVVVRNTSEAIMVLDPEFRVLQVNPAFERLSSRRAVDMAGLMPPALAQDPALVERIRAAIASSDHWQEEIWATRPDGTRYPVGALAEVVRGAEGRIDQFIVVLQDLSAQKEIEERLRELSATDALTRIANRRTFDDWLEREWERGIRQGSPLSLVMADIDFFKRYNDSYGHVAGDACLQQVAAALKSGVRGGGDLVARYGGEEFVVLLPGAEAPAARAVAESLRERVQALAVVHEGNPATGVVTISLGVATMLPARETAPTVLVELSDAQLYRAKANGRNRVEP